MQIHPALRTARACKKKAAYWNARMLEALAEFARDKAADKVSEDEVATQLQWTSREAAEQLSLALDLTTRLPDTAAALRHGKIDMHKADVLRKQTKPLSNEQARQVEAHVLALAPEQTGPQMAQHARRVVKRVDPEGARERSAARASKQVGKPPQARTTCLAALSDMIPAAQAVAIEQRIGKIAQSHHGSDDDARTLNQRRANAMANLLLATPTGASSTKVHLYLSMSATTLMGLDNDPAELARYGPISADMARELAGDASWHQVVTGIVPRPPARPVAQGKRPAALRRSSCGPATKRVDLSVNISTPSTARPATAPNIPTPRSRSAASERLATSSVR